MLKELRRNVRRHMRSGLDKIMGYDRKTHILIACFPKSGSTYLVASLTEITGFKRAGFADLAGNSALDIEQAKMEKYRRFNTVTRQHVKGTASNIALLKEYGVKPVVLTRDIFDVVLSLHDHIEREKFRTTGYIHREYFQMSKEDKMMYLIRIHLPWYFNFLISWREASDEIDVLWITYEELFSDQRKTISKILDFYSLTVRQDEVHSGLEKIKSENTRFNVGKSGRGRDLPDTHKQAIRGLAKSWKVDGKVFKTIGLDL
jgi:hypothetical protein